jgi:glycosyltransferase involved in cell wall biosynthesis
MAASTPLLGIILPCYNEADVLARTSARLEVILQDLSSKGKIDPASFMAFVDDGSTDTTWQVIESLQRESAHIKGLKLSSNCGHQKALLAGMLSFKSDCTCIITMDSDLQDDEQTIASMVQKFGEGNELVYGVRNGRSADTFIKRQSAQGFYFLMNRLGVNIVYNHADFRLVSKRVLEELSQYTESNLFLRGLFPHMGFKQCAVYYERKKRIAGARKFTFRMLFELAMNGITSFSIRPLRMIAVVGLVFFKLSVLAGIWCMWKRVHGGIWPHWAFTALPVYFIGSIQLISLGILGEYLGKIYNEVRRRPLYLVEKKI